MAISIPVIIVLEYEGLPMDVKVRDLFRQETSDRVKFKNFDDIYYIFEKLLDFDVPIQAVSGLSEQFTVALDTIATSKLDRLDMLRNFPLVWGNFEVYVKKIVYIINRKKYKELKENAAGLAGYLKVLDIEVNVPEHSRTDRTEIIFRIYKLRNIDAHECQKWGCHKLYDELSYALSAILVVTEKSKEALMKVFDEKIPGEVNLKKAKSLHLEKYIDIPNEIINNFTDFEGIKSITIKENENISVRQYDEDGKLTKICSEFGAYVYNEEIEYKYEEGKLKRQLKYLTTSVDSKDIEYVEYEYNDSDSLVKADYYRKERSSEKHQKVIEYEINKSGNGNTLVIWRKYAKNMQGDTRVCKDTRNLMFDRFGRLIKKEQPEYHIEIIYCYDDQDRLTKIEYDNGCYDEVERLADSMVIRRKRKATDKGCIVQKRYWVKGRLASIQCFKPDEKSKEKSSLLREYCFEYFDII